MDNEFKIGLINALQSDSNFRNSIKAVLNNSLNEGMNDTLNDKMVVYNPLTMKYIKDYAAEKKVIEEIIHNFRFSDVKKFRYILPVITDDDDNLWDYVGKNSPYYDVAELIKRATELLNDAFDGLTEKPSVEISNNGEISLTYFIGSIFDVRVWYDINTGKLDAKMTWDLASWETF